MEAKLEVENPVIESPKAITNVGTKEMAIVLRVRGLHSKNIFKV